MSETRQTFAGLGTAERVAWYMLVAISVAVFAWGCVLLWRKWSRGSGRGSGEQPLGGVVSAVRVVFTHAWLMRRATLSGLAHLGVFYGFVVLLIGTTILGIQDDVARPLFGFDFWHGGFYLGYSLFLDVFGVALLVGLVVFAIRRGVEHLPRLRYTRVDGKPDERRRYVVGDWVFLWSLVYLGASGFVLEALRVAETSPSFEKWAPAGWALGQGLRDAGVGAASAAAAHHALWWAHGVVALAFVSAIPFTKALHMLTAPPSVALRDPLAGKRLAPVPTTPSATPGYTVITDFAPRHLLQLDACTKCGKCHEVCPATATALPLSPRDVILDLREHAEGSLGARHAFGIPPLASHTDVLVDGTIKQETLWSCMQCMACVDICPVGIEHVPIINEMRRSLVDRGMLDSRLQSTLETIYTSGNSFGEAKRKRGRWAADLEFAVKDVRTEPAEVLWFVGDYASFDPRNQRATRALAQLLHEAGVDFGILYDAERNAGCDVRRVGEEGLYTQLAEENVKAISSCEFDRIVTTDPHSFHTLTNEYPQLGGNWRVSHHSQLLLELLRDGRLRPQAPSRTLRVTYHDPCKLGRYNGVYQEPRDVLAAVGIDLVEMPRNRDSSFCCGAGGGRIWMSDPGRGRERRPAELRIDEAVSLGRLDYFVVACPKDVTMYEDAIKTSGHGDQLELRELSELVLAAVLAEPVGDNQSIGSL